MKSPVSGFSLIIHVAVIVIATIIGLVIGLRRVEAFKRSLSPEGASPRHEFMLRSISIAIILVLGFFMLVATSVAIQTGYREGAREPQVIFVKEKTHDYIQGAFETWEFIAANFDADIFPSFAVNTLTYPPQKTN